MTPPDPDPVITISGCSGITEGGTASFTNSANPAPASPITVNISVSQSGSWGASGAVTVELNGERRRVWKFLVRLMYWGRDFCWLYERQDQLAFLDGQAQILTTMVRSESLDELSAWLLPEM